MTEAFFTTQELADYLRIDYATTLAMAQRNELPNIRVGRTTRPMFRFPVKAIEAWIAKQASSEGCK